MERLRHQPRGPERLKTVLSAADLSRHERVVAELVAAERAEGWLARCHDSGRYLVPTEELVDAIGALLVELGAGPFIEVCAGDGRLTRGLRSRGVDVVATDASPASREPWEVRALTAAEALERYRPRVVIGSFVPVDSDVDRRVLAHPDVSHYLVLNARIAHGCGSRTLWDRPGWSRTPLPELTRWLVTRHDAWLGDHLPILHHGEAWLLTRAEGRTPNGRAPAGGDGA